MMKKHLLDISSKDRKEVCCLWFESEEHLSTWAKRLKRTKSCVGDPAIHEELISARLKRVLATPVDNNPANGNESGQAEPKEQQATKLSKGESATSSPDTVSSDQTIINSYYTVPHIDAPQSERSPYAYAGNEATDTDEMQDDLYNYSFGTDNEEEKALQNSKVDSPPSTVQAPKIVANSYVTLLEPQSNATTDRSNQTQESTASADETSSKAFDDAGLDDWNARFQTAVSVLRRAETNRNTKLKLRMDTAKKLSALANDFLCSVRHYVKIIIAEHHLPYDQKTIKPTCPVG